MTFYDHLWGSPYGDLTYNGVGRRPNPHRGTDLIKPGGTRVPSYVAGTVASVTKNSVLGWHVTVAVGGGRFVSFCHMRAGSMPKTGTQVRVGDDVGAVAGFGDFTGSAWTGPHIHITETLSMNPGAGPWVDPQPRINATISPAGRTDSEENDMPKVIRRTGNYREWSLIWPPFIGADAGKELGYMTTTSAAVAKEWERAWAQGEGSADMLGAKSPSQDNRDDYMRQQAQAREQHKAWKRGMQTVIGSVSSGGPVGPLTINLTGTAQ